MNKREKEREREREGKTESESTLRVTERERERESNGVVGNIAVVVGERGYIKRRSNLREQAGGKREVLAVVHCYERST